MPSVNVYNTSGAAVGTIDLDDEIFGREYNEALIHQAVVLRLSNQRQGTKCTLTRAEVRGGGAKPWRQKGTGRARHGSIRSPQWKGGGVVFAPKPRDFSKKMNIRARREAIKSALSQKVADGKFIVLDQLNLAAPKTREMVKVLDNLNTGSKVLLFLGATELDARRASGNIEGVVTLDPRQVNVYDVVNSGRIVITRENVGVITEVLA